MPLGRPRADPPRHAFRFSLKVDSAFILTSPPPRRPPVGMTGVEQSDAEAVKWFRRAAEQGAPDAKEELKRLGVTFP